MAKATICDGCRKVLKNASDCRITLYVHPYGELRYDLCERCTEELKRWLWKKKIHGG